MTNTNPAADVTLTPAADDTYAIASVGSTPAITARLRRAGIGHFLGFDPKSATDRAAVEQRIADFVGAELTINWTR